MTHAQRPRAFISHSSNDAPDVELLVQALEQRGIDCWYSARDIGPSKDYAAEIPAALDRCTAFVIVLSKDSIRSRHVRRELEMADRQELPLYPVRLLEIALSNDMAYFFKVGAWLDLHKGVPEQTYDRLAAAIKRGKGFAPVKQRGTIVTVAILAAVALVALGALYFGFSKRLQNIEQGLEPKPKSQKTVDIDAYVTDYSGPNYIVSPLQSAQIDFYGLKEGANTVRAALYVPMPNGKLRKIGEGTQEIRNANEQKTISIPTTEKLSTYRLCAIFDQENDAGSKEVVLFSKLYQAHTSVDQNIMFRTIDQNSSCDAELGYSDTGEFSSALATANRMAAIEQAESLATVGDIKLARLDRVEYNVEFDRHAAKLGSSTPKTAYGYIFGADDGLNWSLLDVADLLISGGFVNRYSYRQVLPPYVRVCASTQLQSDSGAFQSQKTFRSVGDSGEYEAVPSETGAAFYFDGLAPCEIEAKKLQALSPHTRSSPLNELLTEDSHGVFDATETRKARAALAAGTAYPYGPMVNGIRLGMPFDEAVAAIRAQLPLATVRDLPDIGPFGRLVLVSAGQRFRTVTLGQSKNVKALAGAAFSYEPDGIFLEPDDVISFAQKRFGPDVPNVRRSSPGNNRSAWGPVMEFWCDYRSYSEPVLTAAFKEQKCTGLFVESRTAHTSNSTGYHYVGLFDWETFNTLSQ